MVILCLVVCLSLSGCGGSKVTKANYDKIKSDMSEAQVKEILGEPTETQDLGAGKTYIWKSGNDTISIGFVQGKLTGKLSSFDVGK
jgi:hypothetical protein